MAAQAKAKKAKTTAQVEARALKVATRLLLEAPAFEAWRQSVREAGAGERAEVRAQRVAARNRARVDGVDHAEGGASTAWVAHSITRPNLRKTWFYHEAINPLCGGFDEAVHTELSRQYAEAYSADESALADYLRADPWAWRAPWVREALTVVAESSRKRRDPTPLRALVTAYADPGRTRSLKVTLGLIKQDVRAYTRYLDRRTRPSAYAGRTRHATSKKPLRLAGRLEAEALTAEDVGVSAVEIRRALMPYHQYRKYVAMSEQEPSATTHPVADDDRRFIAHLKRLLKDLLASLA